MKNKLGRTLMVVGAVFIFMALLLFVYNEVEAKKAATESENLLQQVKLQTGTVEDNGVYDMAMPEVVIDEKACIGYLTVPSVGVELPVFSDWSYSSLRLAPCRYSGSVKTDDLVIAAHNYQSHFGRISKLSIGDTVYFTGMDGKAMTYAVASMEVLEATAIEEMKSSGYPLTMFTCTYGGKERLAVRCTAK